MLYLKYICSSFKLYSGNYMLSEQLWRRGMGQGRVRTENLRTYIPIATWTDSGARE